MDDHQFYHLRISTAQEHWYQTCAQIVVTCLYVARFGRPDLLWTVTMLARSVATWNKARGKKFARLISCINPYCFVGHKMEDCRLGLFQHASFARDLQDSKSTLGGVSCVFGPQTDNFMDVGTANRSFSLQCRARSDVARRRFHKGKTALITIEVLCFGNMVTFQYFGKPQASRQRASFTAHSHVI